MSSTEGSDRDFKTMNRNAVRDSEGPRYLQTFVFAHSFFQAGISKVVREGLEISSIPLQVCIHVIVLQVLWSVWRYASSRPRRLR
jgi:hypothetical protein